MESLINGIINIFSGLISMKFGKELIVFIISLLPLLELRGGLIAASLLQLNPLTGYIVSIIGNIIPVPFILLFINKILEWMRNSKVKWLNKVAKWLDKKANKNKSKIEKYGYLGLVLFVGIPLPGTGAWTGCLAASVLEMDKKKSFFSVMLGVLMASIIMMIISYGILGNLIK
ncbi:MAG: small multi-drug export protein [Bacilli bacterium]|nr:small multi-drug export protein [Bacilli bacterium]